MAYWAVAQAEPQRENVAVHFINELQYETYLPVIRGHKRAIVPLFPGYIFVRIEMAWWAITRTVGVLRVLMNGENPARCPESEILKIRAKEKNGIVRLPPPRPKFLVGDTVRILTGAFTDRLAIYDGMTPKQRELVLLDIMGRKVPLEFGKDEIEPTEIRAAN